MVTPARLAHNREPVVGGMFVFWYSSATMSVQSASTRVGTLAPFQRDDAYLVARWAAGPEDLLWLAPHTAPPLTAEKVLAWHAGGVRPFVYLAPGSRQPVGYGEINDLARTPQCGWIGHLVIRPEHRRCGYGVDFVRQLTAFGLGRLKYRRIYILVFPGNTPALRCYEKAGYARDGYETRSFRGIAGRHQMLRLVAQRKLFGLF